MFLTTYLQHFGNDGHVLHDGSTRCYLCHSLLFRWHLWFVILQKKIWICTEAEEWVASFEQTKFFWPILRISVLKSWMIFPNVYLYTVLASFVNWFQYGEKKILFIFVGDYLSQFTGDN